MTGQKWTCCLQKHLLGLRQHMEQQKRPCAASQAQFQLGTSSFLTTDLLMQATGCQWAPLAYPSLSACAHPPRPAGAQGSGIPEQAHCR